MNNSSQLITRTLKVPLKPQITSARACTPITTQHTDVCSEMLCSFTSYFQRSQRWLAGLSCFLRWEPGVFLVICLLIYFCEGRYLCCGVWRVYGPGNILYSNSSSCLFLLLFSRFMPFLSLSLFSCYLSLSSFLFLPSFSSFFSSFLPFSWLLIMACGKSQNFLLFMPRQAKFVPFTLSAWSGNGHFNTQQTIFFNIYVVQFDGRNEGLILHLILFT